MADLEELARRLEEAAGPDSNLDYAIYLATDALPSRGDAGYPNGPTASLDAAIALCERVLPKWIIELQHGADRHSVALHEFPLPCRKTGWIGARTTPLALCLALVRALQSAPTEGDKP